MNLFRAWLLLGLLTAAVNAAETPAVECQARGGLPNFFAKLNAGGEVKIAYLGGSITAQEGWRPLTLRWFQEHFPSARSTRPSEELVPTWAFSA